MKNHCITYCEHGGVCVLEEGHPGLHDSRYCQWSDEQSLSREEADAMLRARGPLGEAVADLWDAFI